MYAYFNELEINSSTEQDLIKAGHMIANIKEGKAGASLDGIESSANQKLIWKRLMLLLLSRLSASLMTLMIPGSR